MIRLVNLEVSTRSGDVIVGIEDLRVAVGERVALLGPSGAGKSVTSSVLAGTTAVGLAVTGSVCLDGIEVATVPLPSRPRRLGVSLIHQDSSRALNPLVRIGPQLARAVQTGSRVDPVAGALDPVALLEAMGLTDPLRIMDSPAHQLSGGQRQRVCIALALSTRPRVLIADEPTSAVDVVTRLEVLQCLQAHVASTTTFVLVTHDVAAATALCDRAVVLREGKIEADVPMQRLVDDPPTKYCRSLLDQARARKRAA